MGDVLIVGANEGDSEGRSVGFDVGFLRAEDMALHNQTIDTVTLASILFPTIAMIQSGTFELSRSSRIHSLIALKESA